MADPRAMPAKPPIESKMAPQQSWAEIEKVEARAILQAFWNERILKFREGQRDAKITDSINGFKMHIQMKLFSKDKSGKRNIRRLFNKALYGEIEFDKFCEEIQKLDVNLIYDMNNHEQFITHQPGSEEVKEVTPEAKRALQHYMRDNKISAAVVIKPEASPAFSVRSANLAPTADLAMLSVGKVFTGVLTLLMVQEGVLTEADLKAPLQLAEDDLKRLPDPVRKRITEDKITLHQAMTHYAGLGDYFNKYQKTTEEALEKKEAPPEVKKPEDLLPFVDGGTITEVGKWSYSNTGILLTGLAIKRAFEKRYPDKAPCDYHRDILWPYLIKRKGLELKNFSTHGSEQRVSNPAQPAARFIVGCPAGGYWSTAEDLAQFGQWVYQRYQSDREFARLVQTYGQEFFYEPSQILGHAGNVPSASAHLSVSLTTGSVVAILSDQPDVATRLDSNIRKNMLAKAPSPVKDSAATMPIQSDATLFASSRSTTPPPAASVRPNIKRRHSI